MHQMNKSNSLLCAIDFFRKYVWVVALKDKREVSIVNSFQKTLDN